jgi:hypothetical protein
MMLDRANGAFIPYIFEELPELHNSYSGFVYYPNTVSFGENTAIGAPPLFGGYEYAPLALNKRTSEKMISKINEALMLMPLLFLGEGYNVTVTDQPYTNFRQVFDAGLYGQYPAINALATKGAYNEFWMKENNLPLPKISDQLKRNLLWYGILRISPSPLRPYIYLEGDWCSPFSMADLVTMLEWYAVLDYLPELTRFTSGETKGFVLTVNMTTHESAYLEAPEYIPAANAGASGTSPFRNEANYHVNAAALKRVGEWLDFLKAENVYDNTRIILVADHGNKKNFVGKKHSGVPVNLDAVNPLLLVKDFNARGALTTNDAFMSNADTPYLAMQSVIPNPRNPFTGKELSPETQKEAKNEPLYIAVSPGAHIGGPEAVTRPLNPHMDYYVKDNIFVPENWIRADHYKTTTPP